MNIAVPGARRKVLLLSTLVVTLVALATVALNKPAWAPALANPSNILCKGHLDKGAPDPDDDTAVGVAYKFACSGPITGYSIISDKEVSGMETEVFALDLTTGAVLPNDFFSCNGDIPGYGVNCNGTYAGGWNVVPGEFFLSGSLCEEPRLDAQLSVSYATYAKKPDGSPDANKDGTPKITTAVAGPFELGRPRGCPKSKFGGKTRIPQEGSDDVIAG